MASLGGTGRGLQITDGWPLAVWTVQVAPELPEGLWVLMGPSLRTGLGQVRTAGLVGRGHSVRKALREAELEGTGGTPPGKANSREESENCSLAGWVGLFSAEKTVPKPPELSGAVCEYSTVSTFTDTMPFICVGGWVMGPEGTKLQSILIWGPVSFPLHPSCCLS